MSASGPERADGIVGGRRVRRVGSPCVSICLLDDADVCTGCFRTAAEITDWNEFDDDARRVVIAATRERMRAAGVLFETGTGS